MGLRRLQVTDLRCLRAIDLQVDSHYTLISGANGSGKTSVLEAIYFLGRGRSFRTPRPARLIRAGCDRFIIFGEVETQQGSLALGIEGNSDRVRARIAGRDAASIAELASHFPVQIIDPDIHQLIELGPAVRRRLIDWGVFHVEPPFLLAWQRYRQALAQRNAALRQRHSANLIGAWDPELIRTGEEIHDARLRYVARLETVAQALVERLLGMTLELRYRSGWPGELTFEEALRMQFASDRERGVTQVGPHRAELVVQVDGIRAREHVSRGQQKLLAAALAIAQLKLLESEIPEQPTLLLDDPAAELDSVHLAGLIRELRTLRAQLIVTTLDPEFTALGEPGRRFSLQQGEIRP
jgi:DNA replication and repair protein RecF